MMKKIFLILVLLSTIYGYTQTVIQAEYFWDNDPGQGNAIAMSALDGNFNQALESVIKNGATLLAVGDHTIGIRVKGQDTNWSPVFRKVFRVSANNNSNNLVKITQAEYFWDNDPGQGAGNAMLVFDGNFNQALESVMSNGAILPAVGNHTIGIRVKADDGVWGTVYRKVFRLAVSNNSNNLVKVTQAEYYWDNDPGHGAGNTMLVFDGNFNQALESVMSNGAVLPAIGNHTIGIRVKANDGNWGTVYKKVFRLAVNNNSNNLVKITQAEFFWDNDPGQGAGNTMLVFDGNFNQALESVMSNGVILPSVGNHTIGIRVKADDGVWGTVYRKVFRLAVNNNSNNLVKVTQAEYFWNTDPGNGNGTVMLCFDGNFNQALETVIANNAALPSVGLNLLNVRIKADDGYWGTLYRKVIGLDITYNQMVTLVSPANGATNVALNANLVWNTLTGAGSYEYQYATDANFNTLVNSGIVSGTTHQLTGLTNNTTYYWRVRANVNGNVSLWSSVWSFTTTSTLSDTNFELEKDITIHPNPTSEYIYVNSKEEIKELIVIDSLGKKVSIQIENNAINVSSLAEGVYFLKALTTDNKIVSLKFIKE